MPFVEIHLLEGKPPKYVKSIADQLKKALQASLKNPKIPGRFYVVNEYKKENFFVDPHFGGVKRSKNTVYIVIHTAEYSMEVKKNVFKQIVSHLGEDPKIPKKDIFVVILEIPKENWFIGKDLD